MNETINITNVAQALCAIHLPGATPEQIHIANAFLADSQSKPQFPLLLLEIYAQAGNQQLQLSSLLLFTNVIKRNWGSRGKAVLKNGLQKEQIKGSIMKACVLHNMKHYKHFNALLKVMTRNSYPDGYQQLHHFVLGSMQNMLEMAEKSPELFLGHVYTVPVLSLCKAVMKEYSNKRISHTEQHFRQYIVPVVGKAVQLSIALQKMVKEAFGLGNKGVIVSVLQFLRKADKITLYGLLSMPTAYQSEVEITDMIKEAVIKIKEYDDLLGLGNLDGQIKEEVEKYIIGILQLVTKSQYIYPFLFAGFLKDYLMLLINMLMQNVPQGRYSKDKLISVIVSGNLKPINTYPYYTTPEDFRASIYCRKSNSANNNQLQEHCYSVFREMYNKELIRNTLVGLISEIMTIEVVVEGHKLEFDQLVLEDVEVAIVDQVAQPSAYENCLNLCKVIIKNFKEEAIPIMAAMLNEIPQLRGQGGKGRQIASNLVDVVLFLPQIVNDVELPLGQVQEILGMLYEQQEFQSLSRVIRKYFQFFDTKVQRTCLDLLVQIVSSPISNFNNSEVIYQAALALKTVISEASEFDGISTEQFIPCVANILTIMKNKQFVTNPTLLWPIINLIIKLVSTLYESSTVESLSIIIINGLTNLLASPKNEELITCALTQLLACIMQLVFCRIKEEFPIEGMQHSPIGAQKISSNAFVIYEGAYVMVKMNLNNRALENYDNVYRLWLTLLRHYPTLYQQKLYGFEMGMLNGHLKELFEVAHLQVLNDCSVLFLQILEEMFLIGLIPLEADKIEELIIKHLNEQQQENKRIRIVLATLSLYLSFALTRTHIPNILLHFLKELLGYKNKVSPPINTLRCFLYLALNHYILTCSAVQVYQMFTMAVGGNFTDWLEPFLFSMQYVSTKEISKLNAAGILKSISQIGMRNYAQMLLTAREGQFPMDWVLRTINAKLDGIPEPSKYHQDYLYKTIIPNDLTSDDFGVVKLRKMRLHFGHPFIRQIIEQDLRGSFRQQFGGIFRELNWGVDDLQERVGFGTAAALANLLGWQSSSPYK